MEEYSEYFRNQKKESDYPCDSFLFNLFIYVFIFDYAGSLLLSMGFL